MIRMLGGQLRYLEYLNDVYYPSRVNLGASTLRQMQIAFRNVPFSVTETTSQLVTAQMKLWLQRGVAPAAVNVRRGYLLSVWRHAYRHGHCDNDPERHQVEKVREPRKLPRAWSVEQIQQMLDQAENVHVHPQYPFHACHWIALIELLYSTGLRINAALQLKRTALRGRQLIVPAEIQKDREELAFTLQTDFANRLFALPRSHLERDGRNIADYLIPWPWSMTHPTEQFYRYILRPAGLPHDRKLKFHAIRKTFGTLIAATHGKDVAKQCLGHSSMSVTERYLADPHEVDPSIEAANPLDSLPSLRVG